MDNGNEAAPAPAKKGLVIDFSWLKPWRLTPVRLAVLMAVVALGLGVLPFIKGAFYPGKHEGDTFQLADLAYRVALGEWPHLDFMTPIGYLAIAPIAAFLRVGLPFGHALFAAQLMVALILIPFAAAIIARRVKPDWSGWLYGAAIMIYCVALVHGETNTAISASMHYNRWAWAVAFTILPVVLIPPREGGAPNWAEGLVLGLGLGVLVLMKMTYFLALAPAVALGLILRRWWGTAAMVVLGGLIVAALITAFAGLEFWRAYADDLLAVSRSAVRPEPGEPIWAVAGGPAFVGLSFLMVASVIVLRLGGHNVEGILMLVLLPGFVYITYQNYGNDPQWILFLAFLLWTLRPDGPLLTEGGADLKPWFSGMALVAAAFAFPSLNNMALSPIRHLNAETAKTEPLLGLVGETDVRPAAIRILGVQESVSAMRPDSPYFVYAARAAKPEPPKLNGESLPDCEVTMGTKAVHEVLAHDLEAAGYRGKKILLVDLFSALYLYGDFPPMKGAAPWNYGTVAGVKDADYLVVPLCPTNGRVRATMLKSLADGGYKLTIHERRPLYIVVQANKAS